MADITYDVSDLVAAKIAIDDLIDALDSNKNTLNEKMEILKETWKTDAGTKFFKDHKDTWTDYVDKYVKKLQGVSDMLKCAIDRYSNNDDKVRGISA